MREEEKEEEVEEEEDEEKEVRRGSRAVKRSREAMSLERSNHAAIAFFLSFPFFQYEYYLIIIYIH